MPSALAVGSVTKSFLNPGNVLSRMPRSPGKQVAGGLVTNDSGHQSGQLIIGEPEVSTFLESFGELMDDAHGGGGLIWDFGRTLVKQALIR